MYWFCFLLREVAFFEGGKGPSEGEGPVRDGDEGDDVSVLQM